MKSGIIYTDPTVSPSYKTCSDWYDVASSDILTTSTRNVALDTSDDSNGHLVISAILQSLGCGNALGANNFAVFFKDIFVSSWDRIRFTMEFTGASSCWSILGDTRWGEFDVTSLGLYEFDVNDGDVVEAVDLEYGSWSGESERCDNAAFNFFHAYHEAIGQSEYRGYIEVEQRRNMSEEKAGLGSGYSCTQVGSMIRYKDIQVCKHEITSDPTYAPSSNPTNLPTSNPTVDPTESTTNPSVDPTENPTKYPTMEPTNDPSVHPTIEPTIFPSNYPTNYPSLYPSVTPSGMYIFRIIRLAQKCLHLCFLKTLAKPTAKLLVINDENADDDGFSEGVGDEYVSTTQFPLTDKEQVASSPISFSFLELILILVIAIGAFCCCFIVWCIYLKAKRERGSHKSTKLKVYVDSQTHTEVTSMSGSPNSQSDVSMDVEIQTVNLRKTASFENKSLRESEDMYSYGHGNMTQGAFQSKNKKSMAEQVQQGVLAEIISGDVTTMG